MLPSVDSAISKFCLNPLDFSILLCIEVGDSVISFNLSLLRKDLMDLKWKGLELVQGLSFTVVTPFCALSFLLIACSLKNGILLFKKVLIKWKSMVSKAVKFSMKNVFKLYLETSLAYIFILVYIFEVSYLMFILVDVWWEWIAIATYTIYLKKI